MLKLQILLILCLTLLFSCSTKNELPKKNNTICSLSIEEIEEKVYELNNLQEYDSSVFYLNTFLTCSINQDEIHQSYIVLSLTYKRLFDYPKVLECLDNAETHAPYCSNPRKAMNQVICEKAYANFDIQEYNKADSLMTILSLEKFQGINLEHQAKIKMQLSYLMFLQEKYREAEIGYDDAIENLAKAQARDLPMIYGKKIELYSKTKQFDKLLESYNKGINYADSFKIDKYRLYLTDLLWKAYYEHQDFKNAFLKLHSYDSLHTLYNQKQHLDLLYSLEKKYNLNKKEQQLVKAQHTISRQNTIATILILVFVLAGLIVISIFLYNAKQKSVKEKNLQKEFSNALMFQIENERKRISSELHDGINHEMLHLKRINKDKSTDSKIDEIIDEIRSISRNLHPVMFEQVGLKKSLENLCNNFNKQSNISLQLDMNYDGSLNTEKELQVYRIIQEAINNSSKHSEASKMSIALFEYEHSLEVEIIDNGKGFDVSQKLQIESNSFGLHNLRERTESIGGKIKIHSSSKGTIIELTILI